MSLGISKSNFHLIENLLFKDIIEEIRPGSAKDLPYYNSNVISVVSKVIVFRDDMSKMYCVEFVNARQELEAYYYDWADSQNRMFLKFHAHYHPEETDPSVAQFDPFHLHKKANDADDKLTLRVKDERYMELNNVLEFIRDSVYVKKNRK
ncbi:MULTISPECIES: toxin-antitoxin system TumE family protein [Brevibacillus]|jgi:hypothetical protein|uniref:Uncharacterized protein n=1 Tax=Brevibacillus parabrevis TaxID=54914 RepID=A0A4Y3PN56_BREPA|nr:MULTISPECIES: DUF6516 family protein [Brevibacillus]MBU8713910.1 hypothetical protein [Brevibacillus parabrevis]MDH6350631.1 hypothetical protein [Brevibacillus sp. 1238]MED2255469.1 DUF6516 family protein [Brevibacillus parabrevis]RNB94831.1 hypothetical protein EDM60_13165 [Brevibacillus parabrevis]UED68297.1 DUF6516 family protein [Brevibacillus sp. HD3.3A]